MPVTEYAAQSTISPPKLPRTRVGAWFASRIVGMLINAALLAVLVLAYAAYEPRESPAAGLLMGASGGGTTLNGGLVPSIPTSAAAPPDSPGRAAAGRGYQTTQASWYGPGLYGNAPACSLKADGTRRRLTTRSLWVAALHPSVAHCGMPITICYQRRCYHVRVQDRGAWRSDGRLWDIAPGLRARMGFYGVATVTWKRGWH